MKIVISFVLGILLSVPASGELFPDQGETLFQETPAAIAADAAIAAPVAEPAPTTSILDEPSFIDPVSIVPMPACVSAAPVYVSVPVVKKTKSPFVVFPRAQARVTKRQAATVEAVRSNAVCASQACAVQEACVQSVQAACVVQAQPACVQSAQVQYVHQAQPACACQHQAQVQYVQQSQPMCYAEPACDSALATGCESQAMCVSSSSRSKAPIIAFPRRQQRVAARAQSVSGCY